MINTVVALFVEFGLITEQEGEALAQKIREGTLPSDYGSSSRQVKAWLEEVRKGQ